MKKNYAKHISMLVALVCILTIAPLQAFANEEGFTGSDTSKEAVAEQLDQGKQNDEIAPRDSKHTIRKEKVGTDSGTKYSNDSKKKVDWVEDHYKVYYVYVATGQKTFQYDEYQWSWKGYIMNEASGVWHYVKSDSGTYLKHLDASDLYSFLLSF